MYRQEALDTLRRSDEGKTLLRLTSLPLWAILGLAGTLVVAISLWGVMGHLTTTVEAEGRLGQRVDVFVSADERRHIQEGMTAHLLPHGLSPQEYGYLLGEVTSVSRQPNPQGFRVSIHVPQPYQWTAGRNVPFQPATSIPVSVSIIVQQERPISRLLP